MSIMSIMAITAEIDDAAGQLEPPAAAVSQATWRRVLHALAQGAGVVQVWCPDATATERETLARSLALGAAAQGMALDMWPGAGGLVVRRVVDERREERQGPTMRTGH
jgi:hypothetical protein